MADDLVLDKIKKLLRLADQTRGATPHEARMALAKAEELMIRHRISRSNLSLEERGEVIEEGELVVPRTLDRITRLLLGLINQHFNVRTMIQQSRQNGRLFAERCQVIGQREDVAYAIHIYGFLKATFARFWKEYGKEFPEADRLAYYLGLSNGFQETLVAARHKAENEADPLEQQRYAVVLVSQEKAIQEFMRHKYPQSGRIRARAASIRREDYQQGRLHGARIRLHRPLADA